MVARCMVRSCGKTAPTTGYRFYRIPAIRRGIHQERTKQRQLQWKLALNMKLSKVVKSNQRVCSRHFVSGKPALQRQIGHVDWIPTLNLGPKSEQKLGDDQSELSSDADSQSEQSIPSDDEGMSADEEDMPAGAVVTSQEGSNNEPSEHLIAEEVNLMELLAPEIVIKQEEIEIDDEFLPEQDNESDPIGDFNEEVPDTLTAPAVEVSCQKNVRKRKRKRKTIELGLARFVPGMMVRKKKKLLCLECGQQFESIVTFATHRKRFHLAGLKSFPHACFYCPRKFRCMTALNRHMLHHTRLEAIQCPVPVCQQRFHTAFALANHLAMHQEKVHRCSVCLMEFKSAEMLGSHKFVHHSKPSLYSKTVTSDDHVCFDCGEKEVSRYALKKHLHAHLDPLQCKVCYETSSSVDSFLEHTVAIHNNQADLTYYCCPTCPETFLSAGVMRNHCRECSAASKRKATFSIENQMNCEICGLTYYDLNHLATHMRLHGSLAREEDRDTVCRMCSFEGENITDHAAHLVQEHGFRDRMRSLEEDYQQLDANAILNGLPTVTDSSDDS